MCYITEGEKKAIFANYVLRHPVISVPGVNSFNKIFETFGTNYNVLDYLSAKGARIFVIAYDSDKYINEAVLFYEQKLVELLLSHNFQIALAYGILVLEKAWMIYLQWMFVPTTKWSRSLKQQITLSLFAAFDFSARRKNQNTYVIISIV